MALIFPLAGERRAAAADQSKRNDTTFFQRSKQKVVKNLHHTNHKMLNSFKLEKAPDTVFCIPNFVTEQEEENTLRNIHKAPKPKWTNLLNRRLQNWGGLPKPKVNSTYRKVASTNASRLVTRLVFKHTQNVNF